MIGILKWIRGYVLIKMWGFAPERFFNLCSNRNLLLWDIRKEKDVYYMCISLKAFKQLRKITRKTKTRVVILKRYGLPFLLPKFFARKMFVAGFLLACAFWLVSSLYIWEITITGNERITDDMLLTFLINKEIQVGVKSEHVDIETLEKEIRENFKEIIWTSIKISGTKLEISIKENLNVIPKQEEEIPSDLYAEKEGTIVSMLVRTGIPLVKIGDTIALGDMLVTGKIPILNEDGTIRHYQYAQADADIVVERNHTVYETLSFYYIKRVYTGREKKRHFLQMNEKEWLMGKEPSFCVYDVVESKKEISLLKGLSLPFTYGTKVYREYQNVECQYSMEEAETILQEIYRKYLKNLEENNVLILDKNVKISTGETEWILHGNLRIREEIGNEVPIAKEP